MNATVIDTLKFADRLKEAGFQPPQAEGLARALGTELAERMVSKRDLDEAVRSLRAMIEAMDGKFEAKFEAMDAKFEAMDAKFEAKFEALEPRFDAIDAKFRALNPRFDAIDAKLESQHREFSGRFNIQFATMALGFTLVIGLIGYSLFSSRPADAGSSAVEDQTAEVRVR